MSHYSIQIEENEEQADFGVQLLSIRMIDQRPEALPIDSISVTEYGLTEGIERVLQLVRLNVNLNQNVLIRMSIDTLLDSGQSSTLYIPGTWDLQHLHAEELLRFIAAKLNSDQSYQPNFLFRVGAVLIPMEQVAYEMGGSKRTFSEYEDFVHKKRSIVKILPSRDRIGHSNSCVLQWITLGLSYLVENGTCRRSDFDFLTEWYSYTEMTRANDTAFRKRANMTKHLSEYFGFPLGERYGVDVLEELGEKLGIHFVLLDFGKQCVPIYPPPWKLPFAETSPMIIGLVNQVEHIIDHVDFVRDPSCLFQKQHHCFCPRCCRDYVKKRECMNPGCGTLEMSSCVLCHRCDGICGTCLRVDCIDEDPFVEAEERFETWTCRFCKRVAKTRECRMFHEQAEQCQQYANVLRCSMCHMRAHTHRRCNEFVCWICYEVISVDNREQHVCFLRRSSLRPPHTNFLVYDFECAIEEIQADEAHPVVQKRHVPYCVTAWFPYGYTEMDRLIERFHGYTRTVNSETQDSPVFIFFGLGDREQKEGGVYDFFLFLKQCQGVIAFAHNAKAYDHMFIKSYFIEKCNLFGVDIRKGAKYLQITYPELKLIFRDTIAFIPTSLRKTSSDFGIAEWKKGYFPHKWATIPNLERWEQCGDWTMEWPELSDYELDEHYQKPIHETHRELQQWLENQRRDQDRFDFKKEAIDYCISDTVLLGQVIRRFRESVQGLTTDEFDCFQYPTLPTAIMRYYLAKWLPEKQIAILDRSHDLLRIEAWTYFEWMRYTLGGSWKPFEFRQFVWLQIERAVEGSRSRLLLFLPCATTGCSYCYFGTTYVQRFLRTAENLRWDVRQVLEPYLSQYEIHRVRECEWKRLQEFDSRVREWKQQESYRLSRDCPLDPREAYKGGKSEAYKFLVDHEPLQMVDFVSQYPTVLLGESQSPMEPNLTQSWYLPTGAPKRDLHHLSELEHMLQNDTCCGIAKVVILPPSQLYAPFLSWKVQSRLNTNAQEVLYGLCRTCMDERNDQIECQHTCEERSFYGVWTFAELRHAKRIGYHLLNLVDAWVYPSSSKELFRTFIIPFVVGKITSKRDGLVTSEGIFTEQGEQVRSFLLNGLGQSHITPSSFENLPSKRTVCKLMQNAFTGKWGQRDEFETTRIFTKRQVNEVRKMFFNRNINILDMHLLTQKRDCLSVTFEWKLGSGKGHRFKNDLIVAHITAYGRIMLNQLECTLGDKLCYVDTDSAFHIQSAMPCYTTGFRIGDLELEIPLAIRWVALGRKSYAYDTPTKQVAKQKGVMLKQSNACSFLFDQLRLYLEQRLEPEQKDPSEHAEHVSTTQTKFVVRHDGNAQPTLYTRTEVKRTTFHTHALKRIVKRMHENYIDTIPFGYKY